MTSWTLTTREGRTSAVRLDGYLVAPVDVVDADVEFWAEFTPAVLDGVDDFLGGGPVPWRLTATADGGFERDGGTCQITELHVGWCTDAVTGEPVVDIDASVQSQHRDVEANVRQSLLRYDEDEIPVVRRVISALLDTRR